MELFKLMTFWPKFSENSNTISTLDNSLRLKLLENKKVFVLETHSTQKIYSVDFALKNFKFLEFPLNLLLGNQIFPKENYKQDLLSTIQNLDILFSKNEIHETTDAIYFILREAEENILQIILKSNASCLEIDSDFEYLRWFMKEEYVYSMHKLPWNLHGIEIKNILSQGLDFYISFSKIPKNNSHVKDEIQLKSGIKKEITIKGLATFSLYLDSRITVLFCDRTIVRTDMDASRFHVLCKDGQEIVLVHTIVGFERYIGLVKQFIEWNKNGCTSFENIDVLDRLNTSREFLKRLS